ncbi:hypothetical protein F4677DRAFT_84451 [Hypoxylon crocopeplum]|nr:hypothetical protein F4677DRAFT_84451 [Hypoxylon crocopeplum]
MAAIDLACANSGHGNNAKCTRNGKYACKNCRLVLYCGADCQKSHWKKHQSDCTNNPLLKANWRPRWEVENREPAFVGGARLQFFNHQMKYPWGNVPAFDLLKLESNEGTGYGKDLNLLFAASGDIRNVIKTIASIPDGFQHPIKIHLNDKDADIVGRNAIMLLLALTEGDAAIATDNIIHTWYSAFISQSLQDTLKGKIRELVQDVCTKVEGKAPNAVLGKTWTFGPRSLRLVLAKKQWFELLASLEPPPGLTIERAREIRRSVTLAPQRVDFRERRYFAQPPGHRASAQKFREDGVLIPYGAPRDPFTIPNPTLFRDTNTWPMKDDADPLDGWRISDIVDVDSGLATNDVYCKLSFLLKDLITRFYHRLKSLDISFQLLNVNAEDLHHYIEQGSFDRIEISNICDAGYLGIGQTIASIGFLLKQPKENPHATLVALFLNAVDEVFDDNEKRNEFSQVLKYKAIQPPTGPYDANIIVYGIATQQVRDVDKCFDRYMKLYNFATIVELSGMEFKKKHTIIGKWPMRLKLKPHQKGAKEEFDLMLSSSVSGCERYMEWRFKA